MTTKTYPFQRSRNHELRGSTCDSALHIAQCNSLDRGVSRIERKKVELISQSISKGIVVRRAKYNLYNLSCNLYIAV